MPDGFPPDDWPFQTLKLGEYFALSRSVARRVREGNCELATAVGEVLRNRRVTEQEREMIRRKALSILVLGLEVQCPVDP